jgi:hypothetical protein
MKWISVKDRLSKAVASAKYVHMIGLARDLERSLARRDALLRDVKKVRDAAELQELCKRIERELGGQK